MDPIEKAIRGALEKGDVEDSAFRRRIYASAEQALARSLTAKPNTTAQEQAARIQHLRSIAANIEGEFTPVDAPSIAPQMRPVPGSAPTPHPAPRAQQSPNISVDMNHGARRADNAQATRHPVNVQVSDTPANRAAKHAERRQRSRTFNRLAGIFVFLTLLAMAIMLGWTIWTSGILNPGQQASSSGQNNGATTQEDDASNWITVFMPNDISTVQLSEGVTAELQGTGANAFLNLVSSSGNGLATFEVGRGVLESLQGKKVVFDIRARTLDGSNVEMAVGCDLAGMGQCQRTRFQLDGQVTDNLLIVQLADTGPEASGILTIAPDLTATGKPVNVQSVRVRVEP